MSDLQTFTSERFGSVRILEEDGKVLFCGKDIARSLGYARPNEAISKHCKGTLKRRTPTGGGVQEMLFIPEGDVYRLIVNSRLPAAQEFESWVFDEVLPSLRRDGFYATDKELRVFEKNLAELEKYQAILESTRSLRVAYETLTSDARRRYLSAKAVRDDYADREATLEKLVGLIIHDVTRQRRLFPHYAEIGGGDE